MHLPPSGDVENYSLKTAIKCIHTHLFLNYTKTQSEQQESVALESRSGYLPPPSWLREMEGQQLQTTQGSFLQCQGCVLGAITRGLPHLPTATRFSAETLLTSQISFSWNSQLSCDFLNTITYVFLLIILLSFSVSRHSSCSPVIVSCLRDFSYSCEVALLNTN